MHIIAYYILNNINIYFQYICIENYIKNILIYNLIYNLILDRYISYAYIYIPIPYDFNLNNSCS